MTATLTLYQVCNDENGGPFNPVRATMTPSKREALADLRKMRMRYSNVYWPRPSLHDVLSRRKDGERWITRLQTTCC